MELYIKISFWLGVVVTFIRLVEMSASEWPKERKPKTLGAHIAETIIGIAMCVWAGLVLWR